MMHLHENPDQEQKKSFGAIERLINNDIDHIEQEIIVENL